MADRIRIVLVCEECGSRNYQTTKARQAGQNERLTLRKFCPTCKRHTTHRESR